MEVKEIKNLATGMKKGTNPVEVAGFGIEKTHQRYLTWLLNLDHWKDARKAINMLVDSASITLPKENNRYREIADNWKRNFSETSCFWCEYEQKIGNGKSKVDLLLSTNHGNNMNLPIELKTDTKLKKTQLKDYSSNRENELGLAFLLGSSAVRDDYQNDTTEINGCFGILTVEDILSSWQNLYHSMPQPGKDWYDSLKNEALRLNCAFEIENYDGSKSSGKDSNWQKKYGYRGSNDNKHLYFSRLHAVRKILSINEKFGNLLLYDGGFNTVLNFRESKYSWKNIPNLGENKYYWEFNDDDFTLKVKYEKECGDDKVKEWIVKKQDSLKQERTWPDGVELKKSRKPGSRAKWYVSILRWKLNFDSADSAQSVADQAVKIIELVDNSKILDN